MEIRSQSILYTFFGIFTHLMKYQKLRTTPYHPQSTGMIERWYRSHGKIAKQVLDGRIPTCSITGISAVPRTLTGVSAAELTYGKTLRLPGDYYDTVNKQLYDSLAYVKQLQNHINRYKPKRTLHFCSSRPRYIDCSFILFGII